MLGGLIPLSVGSVLTGLSNLFPPPAWEALFSFFEALEAPILCTVLSLDSLISTLLRVDLRLPPFTLLLLEDNDRFLLEEGVWYCVSSSFPVKERL